MLGGIWSPTKVVLQRFPQEWQPCILPVLGKNCSDYVINKITIKEIIISRLANKNRAYKVVITSNRVRVIIKDAALTSSCKSILGFISGIFKKLNRVIVPRIGSFCRYWGTDYVQQNKTFFVMMVRAEGPQELQCFHFSSPNLDYSPSACGHSDDLIFSSLLENFFSRIFWTSVSKWHWLYSMAKKPQPPEMSAKLFFFSWSLGRPEGMGRGGGCNGCAHIPSQGPEIHFFIDQWFKTKWSRSIVLF